MDIKKKFGMRVKILRKSKGISQEFLAERAQLDRTYIGGIERGERNVSLINIEKIAKALDIEIDELFKQISVGGEQNVSSNYRL